MTAVNSILFYSPDSSILQTWVSCDYIKCDKYKGERGAGSSVEQQGVFLCYRWHMHKHTQTEKRR